MKLVTLNLYHLLGSPFKCPIISTMLDGPSMIRVGNTAYMDLEMPGLEGPVSAEVTGKIVFQIIFNRIINRIYII